MPLKVYSGYRWIKMQIHYFVLQIFQPLEINNPVGLV